MKAVRIIALACAVSAIMLGGASAQTSAGTPASDAYAPKTGQEGKDVVWVPTPQALVDRMMKMAGVTKDDYLVDLGSGDGRTVITAATLGVRAHGIEYNGDLVELSKRNAQAAGVADRATFERADIFESDFSNATVVTLFLLKTLNLKLRPTLLDMKPGTRVVSNTFDMGDWTPDDKIDAGAGCTSWCTAYKWVIPAKVDGAWRLGEGELKLKQTYQMLSGTITANGKSVPISDARMDGAQISFTAGGQQYTGTVADGKMSGKTAGGQTWSATR